MLPVGRTIPGRMLIGLVATIPVALSIAMMAVHVGWAEPGLLPLKVALQYSLLMGPLFGQISWYAVGPNERFE